MSYYKRTLLFVLTCLSSATIHAQIGNVSQKLDDASLLKLPTWNKAQLSDADKAQLHGIVGSSFDRSVDRLSLKPFTTEWLMADVTFKVKRIFTNYSGDVSGRFIELGSLLSTPQNLYPEKTLPETLRDITSYQKEDGHFGVPINLNQPLKANDAVVTLLWGNARMLVGLVTAWEKFGDERLLQSAKRLGDFYVNSSNQLCNPAREAEYKATGTAADSYQVGYFPAMEGLVMLYNVTRDQRYLQMAERMAAFFLKFDGLPLNHSHGNLSAWRSILDLYSVTGKPAYLQQAIDKWKESVKRGYVWSIGGVGEHWYVDYKGSEGCSESDWLRFNLDLWRHTGQTSYLDMAERLLENQYIADQSGNGGFGMRHFDVIKDVGPIATYGGVNEWDFCCSFHGPLGLYFFKKYLVSHSGEKLFINFPYSFSTQTKVSGTTWNITTKTDSLFDDNGGKKMLLTVTPVSGTASQHIDVYIRVPVWSQKLRSGSGDVNVKDGYALIKAGLNRAATFEITFHAEPFVEARNFIKTQTASGGVDVLQDVSLVLGSQLLYEYPARNNALSNLLVLKSDDGRLKLLRDADGRFASVQLPDTNTNIKKIVSALGASKKISLIPWPVPGSRRTAFSYNLVMIPENAISRAEIKKFETRVPEQDVSYYGCHLERNKMLWPNITSWRFTQQGIHIKGGDAALIEGGDYKNYKFEFDMVLPEEGQGISGWVVQAKDPDNFLLLQLQSSDSRYSSPEHKTQPNTMRIIPRTNGQHTVEEPVKLATNIIKGKKYHIVTECIDNDVMISIDGQKVASYKSRFKGGWVGFRVSGSVDQGIFSNICLTKL